MTADFDPKRSLLERPELHQANTQFMVQASTLLRYIMPKLAGP